MFDDEVTQKILRTPECGLVTWERVAAALSSVVDRNLAWGNVLLVSSAITAAFREQRTYETARGPIDLQRARAAWNRIATMSGDVIDTDLLWHLFFSVFGVEHVATAVD